jgi:class 3 adenylate cyclase
VNPVPSGGVVCVLFTDLVGSTELMSRLGDVAFDALRGEHFARMREAAARGGGVEVKNTGDGILVTFSSAVQALRAAVAMQQATLSQGKRAGVDLSLRVGLSLGEATFEDGDVFGTPVVEAARLVVAARPGQILASAVTRMVAGSRAPTSFSDLGALELKGLPEPLPACEVAWEPLADERLPLPVLLAQTGRVFVGRDGELERLRQLWKETQAGERRLSLLGGEPGVGKTRLAAELAAAVQAEGATVLAGRCDEDLGVPYQPFVEALRAFVAHTPETELASRLGRHGGELARLLPELAEQAPGLSPPLRSDPETERYRLFDAVTAWLRAVSVETPVLLVLDDLQWAAKPTLLLLRHVLQADEPMRLLMLATYRDTELSRTHPLTELLADLRRLSGVERIPLAGLDSSGVAAYMAEAAGHDLDEDDWVLARAIHSETEGNPFFVGEVLRHLREIGAVIHRDGRWGATTSIEELGIPEGIREVVGRRLSRLSETVNRVLTLAAVIGLEFELPVLQTVAGLDEDFLLGALDEAIAARLVVEVPGPAARHRFAHSLVRTTLYDELSGARRTALHRKVAEAIEAVHAARLDDHLTALAHHYARAAAPAAETAKAVAYASRAGDRALAQLAHDEAAAYYHQALELVEADVSVEPDDARRLGLLLSLGEAQRRAGDPAYRQTLLDAARLAEEQGDAESLARAALANSRGVLMSAHGLVDRERVATLEAALEALGQGDDPTRARLLATLGLELIYAGDGERCVDLSDQALAIARRLDEPSTLAQVLQVRYYSIFSPATLAQRLADTNELLAVAERLGDPATTAWARWLRWRAAMEVGDIELAEHELGLVEGIAAELGRPTLRWYVAFSRTSLLLVAGRIGESERLAVEASALAEATGQADALIFVSCQLFGVRREQDRLDEVLDLWVEVDDRYGGVPSMRAMLACIYAELDRPEQAQPLFEELADSGFGDDATDRFRLLTLSAAVAVAAFLGDRPRASVLHHLLVPYADQIAGVAALWLGSVAHYLGLLATTLGRFDEAEERFAAAEATHDRIGAPIWLARTRLEWARMLVSRRGPGDAERARGLLDQALATATELGLGWVEREARQVLVEAGD